MKFTGWTALSLLILVLGIAFALWMGVGNISDPGVYAVTVTLVAFGLVGVFVSMAQRPADA